MRKKPKPKPKPLGAHVVISEDGMLHCPKCLASGGHSLHHEGVVSYDREEDGENTVRTIVFPGENATSVVPSRESRNPSERRHGLAVVFYCEVCAPERFDLTISQHKGSTYLRWRKSEEELSDRGPAPRQRDG